MIPNRLKAEGDGEKVLRRRCRKSKMLMLADTNSGRRSAITGRHKWSGRALLASVKKCDRSATWVILFCWRRFWTESRDDCVACEVYERRTAVRAGN